MEKRVIAKINHNSGLTDVIDLETKKTICNGSHKKALDVAERLNSVKEYNQDIINQVIKDVQEGNQKNNEMEILIF